MSKYTASVTINAKSNLQKITGGIDKGLKKVSKTLKIQKVNWDKVGQASKKAMKVTAVGVTAVSGAVVAGSLAVYKLTKSTADLGDNLAKTSQKTGVLVEDLQRLRYATELGGGSQKELDTGLRVFSRSIDEASQGTAEYAESFDRLGISVKDNDGNLKSTTNLMYEVADVFKDIKDGASKASLAQQLFGRSGTSLIPMLNQGSEAMKAQGDELKDIGYIMTQEQAKASEKFNDDLLRLRTTITGVATSIGVEMMPKVNEMINGLQSSLEPIRDAVVGNEQLRDIITDVSKVLDMIDLEAVFDWSIDYISDFIEGIKVITEKVEWLLEKIEPLTDFAGSGASYVSDKVGKALGGLFGGNDDDLITATKTITNANGVTQTVDIKMTVDKDGNPVNVVSESASKVDVSIPFMIPEGL